MTRKRCVDTQTGGYAAFNHSNLLELDLSLNENVNGSPLAASSAKQKRKAGKNLEK